MFIFSRDQKYDPTKLEEEVDEYNLMTSVCTSDNIEELSKLVKFIRDRKLHITKYMQKFAISKRQDNIVKASQAPAITCRRPDGLRIKKLVGVKSRNASQIRDLRSHK